MPQENLNHVVFGVLYDFMGFLTTRKKQIVLSSSDYSYPAVEAIQEFIKERQIENAEPLFQWEDRCKKIDNDDTVLKIMNDLKQEMKNDPDYAWGWHCNIACLLLDEGVDHSKANNRAASFMKLAFDVDTKR